VANATDATPWVRAVRASHDRLAGLVAGLDGDGLRAQSYDTEWSIADVLSHLGSGAEIFGLYLDAAADGGEPPSREAFPGIWDTWNARSPEEKAARSVEANEALVSRIESLTPEQRAAFRVAMFGPVHVEQEGPQPPVDGPARKHLVLGRLLEPVVGEPDRVREQAGGRHDLPSGEVLARRGRVERVRILGHRLPPDCAVRNGLR
jgi:hypothetical protein